MSSFQDTSYIRTVKNSSEFVYKEKGSQFIGLCVPVDSVETAEQFYSGIRKKNYDATHNCFAYRVTPDKFRYSDDGEPSGTAGIRILNALDHFVLTDVLVIVTRYFGGTKLGVGPLGKAYYKAAFDTIEKNSFLEKYPFNQIKVSVTGDYLSVVYHLINSFNGKINSTEFESEYVISVSFPSDKVKIFESDCRNLTNGKAALEIDEKIMYLS